MYSSNKNKHKTHYVSISKASYCEPSELWPEVFVNIGTRKTTVTKIWPPENARKKNVSRILPTSGHSTTSSKSASESTSTLLSSDSLMCRERTDTRLVAGERGIDLLFLREDCGVFR